jgi:hypothetical protein
MANHRFALSLSLIAVLALGCNSTGLPGSQPQPAAATNTGPAPSASQSPTHTAGASDAQPGLEVILISRPASGSQVVSPVTVQGEADSTFEQNLVVTITGEDGSLLAQTPTTIQTPLGERGPFSVEISFSVAAQQAGRISVFSTSAMDGSLEHLSSSEVVLLPSGTSQLTQAAAGKESIGILKPAPLAEISGGNLGFSGFSEYFFESTLGVVLCGGGGGSGAPDPLCGTSDNVLALGAVTIDSPDIGQPGPFSGMISYSVTGTTPARLVFYATSPRDGGLLHVSSIPIQLDP